MAASVTHTAQTAIPDDGTSDVGSDEWNAAHTVTLATDRLLGRDTAGSGAVEEIALATSLEFTGSASIQRSALTGDVTASAGSNATTLAAGSASNLNSGTLPAGRMPALTGDVTTSAGAVATTVANDAVTNAKLANMAASTVKGRITGSTGDPEDLTQANLVTLLQGVVGGLPLMVRRTSDSSAKTNNTLADDSQLTLTTIAASAEYFVEAWMIFQGANITMDSKYGWTVPSGATMMWAGVNNNPSQSTANWAPVGTGSSQAALLSESGAGIAGSGSNTIYGVYAAGTLTTTNSGTLTVQWAQNTTDAGNLVMKAKSFIRAWRLA